MLVRLLIAALTLTGPHPLRVCTCAGHADHLPAAEPDAADHGDPTASAPCDHDCDCPPGRPGPVASATPPAAVADLPAAPSTHTFVTVPPPGFSHATLFNSARPAVPLYLSLLSLRI